MILRTRFVLELPQLVTETFTFPISFGHDSLKTVVSTYAPKSSSPHVVLSFATDIPSAAGCALPRLLVGEKNLEAVF